MGEERSAWRRWLWFAGLWLAGVGVVAGLSYALKLLIAL